MNKYMDNVKIAGHYCIDLSSSDTDFHNLIQFNGIIGDDSTKSGI